MKKLLILLFTLNFTLLMSQQTIQIPNEKKYVEVTGVAEMTITPNEIYISITLQEEKEGMKRSVEQQEEFLINKLKKLNIDPQNLKVSNVGSHTYWDKKTKESFKQKTFELMVPDAAKASQVMYELNQLQIYQMYVSKTDHSDIEMYRKEVKVNAVKAAKEKANYLLEAVNEQVGDVIFIVEQDNGYYQPMYRAYANVAMESDGGYNPNPDVEFQPITLKYGILARFEIK